MPQTSKSHLEPSLIRSLHISSASFPAGPQHASSWKILECFPPNHLLHVSSPLAESYILFKTEPSHCFSSPPCFLKLNIFSSALTLRILSPLLTSCDPLPVYVLPVGAPWEQDLPFPLYHHHLAQSGGLVNLSWMNEGAGGRHWCFLLVANQSPILCLCPLAG